MATDVERLTVQFEASYVKFEKALARIEGRTAQSTKRIEKSFETMQGRINRSFSGLGGNILSLNGAGALGLAGVFAGAKAGASELAELNAEAQRAGIGVEAMQRLGYAAEQSGVKFDALVDGIKEMQLRADEFIVTGAGGGAEAFQRLGYSAGELSKKLKDPEALFSEIIDRLGKLDKASQIRISDELFGGTGGEQFVRFLSQGTGYIRRMGEEAQSAGRILNDEMIQKAVQIDKEFNKIATTVGSTLKGAIVSVVTQMGHFVDMLNSTSEQSASTLQYRIDAINAALKKAETSSAARFIMNGSDGQGIARKIEERDALQAELNTRRPKVTITPGGGKGDLSKIQTAQSKAADELRKAYNNLIVSAEQRIAQMGVEAQTIGLTTAAAEEMRVKQELLNQAQSAGIKLTPEQAAKIEDLARKTGIAAAALEDAQKAHEKLVASWDDARSLSGDVMSGFISDLRAGKSATEALAGALDKVADKLLDIALNSALDGMFGPSGASGGGLLGSITKGLTSALSGGTTGWYATGGYTGNGGKYDPAGVVHRGEVVWSQDDIRRAGGVAVVEAMRRGAKGYSNGGPVSVPGMAARGLTLPKIQPAARGAAMTFAPSTTIDARGSQMGEAQFRAILAENNRALLKQVPAAVEAQRRRTPVNQRT